MFRVLCPGLLLAPCLLFALLCNSQVVASSPASDLTNHNTIVNPGSSPNPATANATIIAGAPSLKATLYPVNFLGDALALYRRGKLDAAIEKYRLILRIDPASPEAHAGLARIYLRQGRVELASETVNQGLTFSDAPELRVALGEIYFRQGRLPEAEQEWSNVISSGNRNPRAYLGLARVRQALSLHRQSKAMIDQARELNSLDPDIELDWNLTLPLSERIHLLESYLESPNTPAADDRAASQRYLDYLKMLNQPQGTCHLAYPPANFETPFVRLLADVQELRGYGLAVNLNGRKATLMLDTGASGILVSRKVAEKAGIAKAAEIRIAGVGGNGEEIGYVGLARSIKIANLEFQNCPVRVLDKRSVVEDQGVIGTDVFEDFLINLDFPSEKLRLSALPRQPDDDSSLLPAKFVDAYIAPEMQSYTHLYRFDHYLLVPTRVGNYPEKLFLLDTGGLTNQITPAAAREVTKVHGGSETIITGIGGSVRRVYTADKATLQFGHLREEDQDLIAFDLTSASQSVGTEISGTLGFATLHGLNIKIDYRDGIVDFEAKR
jgi:tetratricopeptide (TPR) repeat protein